MEIQDNFSELLLMTEKPVSFYFPNTIINMKIPNIADAFTDQKIQHAVAILNTPISKIQENIPNIKFDNLWILLNFFIKQKSTNIFTDNIRYLYDYCFNDQFKEEDDTWYLNDIKINKDLFNRVTEIILISMCVKKFNEQEKFQLDKPEWLREKEAEIQRIKSQGKDKNNLSDIHIFETITKIFVQINYELGYSFEQLFNMNYYHIQILQKYIPKIVSYDIQKRSAAVGMTKKKLKYITD